MTKEEAIFILQNIDRRVCDDELSEALDVAIEALEQEPCEDCISRQAALDAIDTLDKFGVDDTNSLFRLDNLSLPNYVPYIRYDDVIKCIKGMPSVTPKQKMGRWIKHIQWEISMYECSECGTWTDDDSSFCPNCGVKMGESEEMK